MVIVPRLWPDSTVVCMATGPSLTQADADYCRGKAPVVAINDAHQVAPWADVLYSSDRQWYPRHRGVPAFAGVKYGIGSAKGKANAFHKHPEIQVLTNTGDDGLELDPSGLRTGSNSGYAAINLAVHLGAVRIVLLGYNMRWIGSQAHFFGSHPAGLNQSATLFRMFLRRFQTIVEPLKAIGVEVINATVDTALTCFPRRSLTEALA